MLFAALHRFDDDLTSLRVVASEDDFQRGPSMPVPTMPAQTTANLQALVADKREAVSVAYVLAADLLADMSIHQPYVLTAEGNIQTDRLNNDYRSQLTGW